MRSFIVALLVSAGSGAYADPAPPELAPVLVGVVGGTQAKVDEALIIGNSGQLYRRTGERWKRTSAGGIAPAIHGAVVVGDVVYAAAGRAPLFEHTPNSWRALMLPNRGRTRIGARGIAVAATLGRHVYRHDAKHAKSWRRITSVPRSITALTVASNKRLHVATSKGELFRIDNKSRTPIHIRLPADDYVTHLGGGDRPIAVSATGLVFRVLGPRALPLAIPTQVSGFIVDAIGDGPQGAVWITGHLPDDTTPPIILTVGRKRTKTLSVVPLDGVVAGERLVFVHTGSANGTILGSSTGSLHWRKDPTAPWTVSQVEDTVATLPPHSATAAPAKSR